MSVNPRANPSLRIAALLVPFIVVLACSAASAAAAPAGPGWRIDSVAAPTNFPEGENTECQSLAELGVGVPYCDRYEVSVTNAGSEFTNGSPVNITDTLSAGLTRKNGRPAPSKNRKHHQQRRTTRRRNDLRTGRRVYDRDRVCALRISGCVGSG